MVTVAIYNLSVRALEQNLELLLCQARLGGGGKGGGPQGIDRGNRSNRGLGQWLFAIQRGYIQIFQQHGGLPGTFCLNTHPWLDGTCVPNC